MKISEAQEKLLKSGNKLTPKRKLMLSIMAGTSKYMSAKALSMEMNENNVNLSYDTIYRNLALLTDLEILEATEIAGEKRYRFSCEYNGHHHHFICTECGVTRAISVCPMDELDEDLSDFEVSGHRFEVYGKCAICK